VCYDIQHLNIDNTQSLPHWLTFRDIIRQAENNCIGVKGIKAIHTAVQNRLISHGFITTRVLIPEQNLHKGTLTLRILPGRVSDVIIQDQSGLRSSLE
jgi:hemolysin activation/secretion protein